MKVHYFRITLGFFCLALLFSCATTTKNIWVSKRNMPTARATASVSVVDDKIYVIGGGVAGSSIVEIYDPQKNTWIRKSDMPTSRWTTASAVADGKIYILGGQSRYGGASLSNVEMYDPKSDKWVRKADMMSCSR